MDKVQISGISETSERESDRVKSVSVRDTVTLICNVVITKMLKPLAETSRPRPGLGPESSDILVLEFVLVAVFI